MAEGFHGHQPRETKHGEYLLRRVQLRVYRHGKAHVISEHIYLVSELMLAHAGDRMPGAQLLCEQAAEHVDLVTVSSGDHQIGCSYTRFEQHLAVRGIACKTKHVKTVLQIHELFLVPVYGDYLMSFLGQQLHEHASHLAGADHDYLHNIASQSGDIRYNEYIIILPE